VMQRSKLLTIAITAVVLLSACGSGGSGTSPTPTSTANLATRPSSPAVLQIVSPTNGEVVTGGTVHVVVALQNATVVQLTSMHIQPDQGHVHLYLDDQLIYMQYRLVQDVPVHPGTYSLKAEFVASDHVPFNPRVWSSVVIFTVH
jgi:ABC-type Fe3+-hydroxamate transport system substrate-binding protein